MTKAITQDGFFHRILNISLPAVHPVKDLTELRKRLSDHSGMRTGFHNPKGTADCSDSLLIAVNTAWKSKDKDAHRHLCGNMIRTKQLRFVCGC